MGPGGLYKWMVEGDAKGGPASTDEPGTPSHKSDNDLTSFGAISTEDLEIEKKWLRLVGVDPNKFDFFFDKYYDRIFAYAFLSTADHDQAGDIAGEVFARAWERRRQFRWQGYSFGAWLFQIARSLISHKKRDELVRKETPYRVDSHEPVDDQSPVDVLAEKADQLLIRRCMEKLNEAQYEVVVLHYFMGFKIRQIALITESPIGTVASQLRRSKRSLQRCLTEHGAKYGLSEAAQRIVQQAALEDSGLNLVEKPDEI